MLAKGAEKEAKDQARGNSSSAPVTALAREESGAGAGQAACSAPLAVRGCHMWHNRENTRTHLMDSFRTARTPSHDLPVSSPRPPPRPNLSPQEGKTPLQRAVDYNRYEVARVLLKAGAEEDLQVLCTPLACNSLASAQETAESGRNLPGASVLRRTRINWLFCRCQCIILSSLPTILLLSISAALGQITPTTRVILYARGDYPVGLERLLAEEPGLANHRDEVSDEGRRGGLGCGA